MEKSNNNNSIIKSNNFNKTKIFVGGLPQDTTQQELADIFDRFGILTSINLPIHPRKKRIKGYAIIEFKDSTSVELAIRHLNGSQIRGKMIAVKVALNSDEASKMTKEMQKRKLFVKGLPLETTESQIWKFFENLGMVEKIQMAFSKQNKKFKGIAYITMQSLEEAQKILSMGNYFMFNGVQVEISASKAIGQVFDERHKRNLNVSSLNRKANKKSSYKFPGPKSRKSVTKKKKNLRRENSYTTNNNTYSRRGSGSSQRYPPSFEPRHAQWYFDFDQHPKYLTGQALVDRHNLLFKNSTGGPTLGSTRSSGIRSQFLDAERGLDNSNYRFNVAPIQQSNLSGSSSDCSKKSANNSVVVRQTIKTEYRIKDNRGIVYLGEINETNLWSSGKNSEESGAEEGEEETDIAIRG